MGIKNIVFFIDLNTLNKKIDDKLKSFLNSEELEEKDVVKIIYNEANRIGEKNKVKVTFQIIDGDEDSFRIIVEPAYVKYKGTIIYPYEKVKSSDFEFVLDAVCGKITLYNKKNECQKISVTIDNVAIDIFSMTYLKAKELLKDISDRKVKNGYIEFPDSICFKQYGIKVNAQKNESGDIKLDEPVASIDVFNSEEFFKEYYFEEVVEEKYDVNIPLPDEYNYEKKKQNQEKIDIKSQNTEIEIDIPEVKVAEKENEVDERQEELDRIKAKQDEELERVKEKLKKELEQELNKSIEKYDEENEKRLQEEINTKIEDEKNNTTIENIPSLSDFKEDVKIDIEIPKETKPVLEEKKEEQIEEKTESMPVEIPSLSDFKEDIKIDIVMPKEAEIKPVEADLKKDEIVVNNNQKEIEELERLLKEERKQQEILENRIKTKLEELKSIVSNTKTEEKEVKVELKNIEEPIKIKEPDGFISYEIESYEGLKEQGKDSLSLFFGQSKVDIRKYFGGAPKEIREYDEMELYDIFYAYYDDEDKCTGIGIYNQEVYKDKIALYMFGQNLITMKYRDIVKLIKKNDYNAIEDDDGIISLKYGISVDPKEVSNYKDEISDVIHIFKKGYYDEVYENF